MTDDVRWLAADEQRAWRAWLDAHAKLSARLNRELQASSGLSLSDYDVLVHLTDVPEGRLRAFELGEGLQWEKSRVSRQVARMAERGLVEREASPEDGRGSILSITASGRTHLKRLRARKTAYLARRLDKLGAEDRRTLERAAELLEGMLE